MDELIKSKLTEDGNPAKYRLKSTTDNLNKSESYRKITFGERNTDKPHKIILMVGETGCGKTTLINTMINYICGVQRKDKVWFEITDEQNDPESVQSQTSDVTIYGVYIQETSVDLTIIDTPGYGDTGADHDKENSANSLHFFKSDTLAYGDTCGADRDKKIAESLQCLCESNDIVHEIHAVCFVINATQTRLSDRQHYIFDAVQCLFGQDIAENIVLLFTHSDGAPPKNALRAVREAEVKCAVDEKKNQPIYFLFNNRQEETFDEEEQTIYDQAWDLSFRGIKTFLKFLDTISPKTLQMTQDALQKRKQLEANISNLHSCVKMMALKQNELKQTQETLEKHKKDVNENNKFEYEVEVPYREKVDIDPDKAKEALTCSVCEENCHYTGCWWITELLCCTVMKNCHCTVCTNKCHYSKHIEEAKIYVEKNETKTDVVKEQNFDKLEKKLQELWAFHTIHGSRGCLVNF